MHWKKIQPENVAIVQTYRAKRIQFHKYVLIIIGKVFDHTVLAPFLSLSNNLRCESVCVLVDVESPPSYPFHCLHLFNHK